MFYGDQVVKNVTFPSRFATWGLPLAWFVVLVQDVAPFLNPFLYNGLVVLYAVFAAMNGASRPLEFPESVHSRLQNDHGCKEWFWRLIVRVANVICDGLCSLASLFFLKNVALIPTPYFVPIFVFALTLHLFVEYQVARVLSKLHDGTVTFQGRGFDPDEVRQLVSMETAQ